MERDETHYFLVPTVEEGVVHMEAAQDREPRTVGDWKISRLAGDVNLGTFLEVGFFATIEFFRDV